MMARLRYNGLSATLGASLTSSATSVTFGAALTHSNGTAVPTLAGGDYIPLAILDASGHLSEIVWLTAYTSGATTGTIARGKEGTSGVAHSSGDKVIGAVLTADVRRYPLTPAVLHPTYGDHFEGTSLDAKWTRAGSYVSGDETYRDGDGSWMTTAQRAAGSYYYQTAPSGDFTLVMCATIYTATTGMMFGLIIVDDTGAGVGGGWYNSNPDGRIVAKLVAAAYSTTFSNDSGPPKASVSIVAGQRVWYKLVKSGTTYTAFLSTNGYTWSPQATLAQTFTPTRIGFGTFFGGATVASAVAIDFFDVQ